MEIQACTMSCRSFFKRNSSLNSFSFTKIAVKTLNTLLVEQAQDFVDGSF